MSELENPATQNFVRAILEVSNISVSEIQKVHKLIEAKALQTIYVFYLDKKDELLAQIDIRFDSQNDFDSQILEAQSPGETLSTYIAQIRAIHDQSGSKRAKIGIIFTAEAGQNISFLKSLGRTVEPLLFSDKKWQLALRAVEMQSEYLTSNLDKLRITMAVLPRDSDS